MFHSTVIGRRDTRGRGVADALRIKTQFLGPGGLPLVVYTHLTSTLGVSDLKLLACGTLDCSVTNSFTVVAASVGQVRDGLMCCGVLLLLFVAAAAVVDGVVARLLLLLFAVDFKAGLPPIDGPTC